MTVGYKLYREVRDFAPADLTSGELAVAWVIADDANDDSRRSWISNAELCFRSRLKAPTVREKLAALAARGFEFRAVHGYDKNGRPVFAAKGHAVDYVVPDFTKGAGLPSPLPVDNQPKGAGLPAPYEPQRRWESAPKALEMAPKGAGLPAPLSSDPLTIPSTTDTTAVTPSVEGTPPCGQPARREPELCGQCGAMLDRDGTCFACRIPMTAAERQAWEAVYASRRSTT